MRWFTFWTRCGFFQKSGASASSCNPANSFCFSARSKIASDFKEPSVHLFGLGFQFYEHLFFSPFINSPREPSDAEDGAGDRKPIAVARVKRLSVLRQ